MYESLSFWCSSKIEVKSQKERVKKGLHKTKDREKGGISSLSLLLHN